MKFKLFDISVLLSQWENLLHKIRFNIEQSAMYERLRADISALRGDLMSVMERNNVVTEPVQSNNLDNILQQQQVIMSIILLVFLNNSLFYY